MGQKQTYQKEYTQCQTDLAISNTALDRTKISLTNAEEINKTWLVEKDNLIKTKEDIVSQAEKINKTIFNINKTISNELFNMINTYENIMTEMENNAINSINENKINDLLFNEISNNINGFNLRMPSFMPKDQGCYVYMLDKCMDGTSDYGYNANKWFKIGDNLTNNQCKLQTFDIKTKCSIPIAMFNKTQFIKQFNTFTLKFNDSISINENITINNINGNIMYKVLEFEDINKKIYKDIDLPLKVITTQQLEPERIYNLNFDTNGILTAYNQNGLVIWQSNNNKSIGNSVLNITGYGGLFITDSTGAVKWPINDDDKNMIKGIEYKIIEILLLKSEKYMGEFYQQMFNDREQQYVKFDNFIKNNYNKAKQDYENCKTSALTNPQLKNVCAQMDINLQNYNRRMEFISVGKIIRSKYMLFEKSLNLLFIMIRLSMRYDLLRSFLHYNVEQFNEVIIHILEIIQIIMKQRNEIINLYKTEINKISDILSEYKRRFEREGFTNQKPLSIANKYNNFIYTASGIYKQI